MPPSPKARIFWDLDDTLNGLLQAWLAWHPRRFARMGAWPDFQALNENPPHRLLGLSLDAYLASLDEFRLSPEGRSLPPRVEALEWFHRHGEAYEHHVLTARPLPAVPPAAEWVFAHFGRWVRHFHFVPARRLSNPLSDMGESKGEVIARLGGADFLVDDDPGNLRSAEGVVRARLLVPQPWNGGAGTLASVLAGLAAN